MYIRVYRLHLFITLIWFQSLPFRRYFWSSETSFLLYSMHKSGSAHEKQNANYTKESFFCVRALVFFFFFCEVEYCHAIFEFLSHAICTRLWLVCESKMCCQMALTISCEEVMLMILWILNANTCSLNIQIFHFFFFIWSVRRTFANRLVWFFEMKSRGTNDLFEQQKKKIFVNLTQKKNGAWCFIQLCKSMGIFNTDKYSNAC